MFRRMLPTGEKIVHEANPHVVLLIEPEHQYSEGLSHKLNYGERDDQLVGTLHRFAEQNAEEDARLLTHDTGPIYTAQGLGLKAELIPETWILRPEIDEQQKTINELEKELLVYRRAEPAFKLRLLDGNGDLTDHYAAGLTWFDPLTDDQINDLVEHLRRRFPMANRSLSDADISQRHIAFLFHDRFSEYCNKEYPDWLDKCRRYLSNIHMLLQWRQSAPKYTFLVENVGTRPAVNALVAIKASGNLLTMPTRDTDAEIEFRLPSPPEPPSAELAHLTDQALLPAFRPITPDLEFDGPPIRRDQSKFYFGKRPSVPKASFNLTCDLWRHVHGDEEFSGEVHITNADGNGALTLRIQAENLSKPFEKTIPVHIHAERVSSHPAAAKLVKPLKVPKKGLRLPKPHSD